MYVPPACISERLLAGERRRSPADHTCFACLRLHLSACWLDALGPSGMAAVRSFVRKGGGYVGTCECGGAFLAMTHLDLYGGPVPTVEPWARGHGPVLVQLNVNNLNDELAVYHVPVLVVPCHACARRHTARDALHGMVVSLEHARVLKQTSLLLPCRGPPHDARLCLSLSVRIQPLVATGTPPQTSTIPHHTTPYHSG